MVMLSLAVNFRRLLNASLTAIDLTESQKFSPAKLVLAALD